MVVAENARKVAQIQVKACNTWVDAQGETWENRLENSVYEVKILKITHLRNRILDHYFE